MLGQSNKAGSYKIKIIYFVQELIYISVLLPIDMLLSYHNKLS